MPTTKPRSSIKTSRPDAAEIASWVPDSGGHSKCPQCRSMVDHLTGITLSGLCVQCAAKADPSPTVHLWSTDPFWLLKPEDIDRAAVQLEYLHAEHERLERSLPKGDWGEAEQPTLDVMMAIEREAMLLLSLCVVSRQGRLFVIERPDVREARHALERAAGTRGEAPR
jgi:hypothetical protein